MTPLVFHVAPVTDNDRTPLTIVCGVPDESRTFRRLLSAKNPIHSLSADQNGLLAPSVPAITCARSDAHERSQSCRVPFPLTPTHTM